MNLTHQQVVEAVTEDIRRHRENGVDINPYSTDGSRRSWQHGFDGIPESITDYMAPHRRGRLAAQLLAEEAL